MSALGAQGDCGNVLVQRAELHDLAEEATSWLRQNAPERIGYYTSIIDYVEAVRAEWKDPDVLRQKLCGIGRAQKVRERAVIAIHLAIVLISAAAAIPVALMQKSSAREMLLASLIFGGVVCVLTQIASSALFLERHRERASQWRSLYRSVLRQLEEARSKGS